MTLLILGIVLWYAAHLFKRVAPGKRAAMQARMGNGSKGVMAGIIALSVVLMVFGYKAAEFVPVYETPSWGVHLNNLLMLVAIALFGAGNSKGRARSLMRHPMLTGMLVWAIAHLVVNGDQASLVLFGGLGLWAVMSMLIVNAAEGPWQRPAPGPAKGDVKLGVITLVLFAVFAGIHGLVGPSPFPG